MPDGRGSIPCPDKFQSHTSLSNKVEMGLWQIFHLTQKLAETQKLLQSMVSGCLTQLDSGMVYHHPQPLNGYRNVTIWTNKQNQNRPLAVLGDNLKCDITT